MFWSATCLKAKYTSILGILIRLSFIVVPLITHDMLACHVGSLTTFLASEISNSTASSTYLPASTTSTATSEATVVAPPHPLPLCSPIEPILYASENSMETLPTQLGERQDSEQQHSLDMVAPGLMIIEYGCTRTEKRKSRRSWKV